MQASHKHDNKVSTTSFGTSVQEASVWFSRKTKEQQQQEELMTVRLALTRSVAKAHLTAFQPAAAAWA